MDAVRKINLIQTKPETSAQTGVVTVFFWRLSLWVLAIFIVSGILAGGVYSYLKIQYDRLATARQELSQIITQNALKEGLLFSIKQRTALITKIMGIQQPVGRVFDMLTSFIPPGQMSDVSVDDKNNVTLSIRAASIDEVISITDVLIKQATAKQIRAPQLISLKFGTTGDIDVGLSFIAVF